MNIAIDISPLKTGHKIRGVGFYVKNLKESLQKYFPDNTYTFFTQGEKIPKEITIVHYPYFELFFRTVPFFKTKKTVVTVHDLIPLIFKKQFPVGIKGAIQWYIQRYLLKQVDAIITDSYSAKKDIVRLVGFPQEKIHVVHLAAGDEFTQTKASSSQIAQRNKKYQLPEKFALYVGDVTWNKNLPRLIAAVQKISVPLVMVGKALVNETYDTTNVWNKDLVTVQKLLQGDTTIICLGFVSTEDLVFLYNRATVFVMPSLSEGFGLPIVEAMRCGCPVVTTREGSIAEVAGEAAYYADAYSVDSIAQAIQKVFGDRKLQDALSQKGLVQAEKFSWQKTAAETIKVYQSIT